MLYSFGRIKVITRGRCKSAVATAAYHSASEFTNEWDGETHDYTYKSNVGDTFIRMPENAPAHWRDENIPAKERLGEIWNTVEQYETSSNAQLARQNYLALQDEFTLEQNLECVDRFIRENCTDQGMGVTYSVHLKPGNHHVDMMYLMREFDQDGNFKVKSQKEYLCRDKSGNERYLSAEQFREMKAEGWEKVYKYRKGNNWEQLTPSEAEKEEYTGYKRASKHPVDRKVEVNAWNDKALAKKWRKSWEVILNEKFEELGMENRVDCRSFKEQGRAELPTVHEGWGASRKEKQQINQEIRAINKELDILRDIAAGAISNAEDHRAFLQTEVAEKDYVPTREDMECDESFYAYDSGVLNAIADSGILEQEESRRMKLRMQRIGQDIRKYLQELWERVKIWEQEKELPLLNNNKTKPKLSLDSIILGGARKLKEQQKTLEERDKKHVQKFGDHDFR